jgi:hypothetical protein
MLKYRNDNNDKYDYKYSVNTFSKFYVFHQRMGLNALQRILAGLSFAKIRSDENKAKESSTIG